MKFYTIPAGPFEVNTYLVFNDNNDKKEGFIIDPGGQAKRIDKLIKDDNIDLKFILNTHCHIDHVSMDNYFKEKYGIKIIANKKDELILKNLKNQAEYLGFDFNEDVVIDEYLTENNVINIGDINILPIFTPGHSPGSTSFLVNEKYLFSGDTLFKSTIGRTDILGGSFDEIISSIKNKLLILGDDIIVLPGHGETSTIGEERKYNAYLI
ncbi:MAG: MBL fold metallo-hydrolase [Deltaproteobacteria bacterium]|jgi:glyoxylase-like metal-dependent hydrolase (beta-lactamase superfamily II)|nr:MBL fold metallo-hydrolase [Deltaproteobacteria bacterium]MCL5879882.1 MBL fold metallo-hydrolase [Deltaproteobacteria bacterium]MDA8304923.1 MBL fold metallo-hydrolase [Deltaproteobacteria bacterium]